MTDETTPPPKWEVRALTGSLAVRMPDSDKVVTTTGGYILYDMTYKQDPIGTFPSSAAAQAYLDGMAAPKSTMATPRTPRKRK